MLQTTLPLNNKSFRYVIDVPFTLIQHSMVSQCLNLAHNCLNFDFMGTSNEESADDIATIQIPTVWRSGFYFSSLNLTLNLPH